MSDHTTTRRLSRPPHGGASTVLLALLLALLLPACSPQDSATVVGEPPQPPRHVLLITVDTLRADHLGTHGHHRDTTPFLDRLAAQGVLFERAIVQWPKTGASFASMFTGRYPQSTGLTHKAALRIPNALPILPEILQQRGFRTAAVVSNPVLSLELGWERGFDQYLLTWNEVRSSDPIEMRKEFAADRLNELALPLIERLAGSERLFLWLHYSDPHAPYILPEGFSNPFLGDAHDRPTGSVPLEKADWRAIGNHRELSYYRAQYDANVLVSDTHIGEAYRALEAAGLLDDTLVIFTADHGESLGEHDLYFEHGPLPYNTTAHVPLFLLRPGTLTAGVRLAEPVELTSLLPTLLAWLFPGPQELPLEGHNLLPLLLEHRSPQPEAIAFAESGRHPRHFRSAQDAEWKLIFEPPLAEQADGRWELYHLASDPLETQNLMLAGLEPAAQRAYERLKGALRRWMKDGTSAPLPSEEISPELRRRLEAMGYTH